MPVFNSTLIINKEMQSNIVDNILEPIERYLAQAGIYYRAFARRKSSLSIKRKLDSKLAEYEKNGKKMQDFVGIRIVFYFQDDVEIFHQKLKRMEGYDSNNESNTSTDLEAITMLSNTIKDNEQLKPLTAILPIHDKIFMPQRLNLVMKMPFHIKNLMEGEMPVELSEDYKRMIDFTYEVQLRTVLSEGWHEVEHDLRYKTLGESWWNECKEESRQLNGIYASLEANEMALIRMIDGIAYKNYKNESWDAMIRNHFRLRFAEPRLSEKFNHILSENKNLAKKMLQQSRSELISWLWEQKRNIAITTDLVLCLVNRKKFHVQVIYDNEPIAIKVYLDSMINQE